MIKFKQITRDGAMVYYYRQKIHYDMAMEALKEFEFPGRNRRLMELADFAIDCNTNQLVKNRSISLETLLDSFCEIDFVDACLMTGHP